MEAVAHSRDGKLLFFKLSNGEGIAPAVLWLRLSFPRRWHSSGNLLWWSAWCGKLQERRTSAASREESSDVIWSFNGVTR
jgi:hypothetical protein